jgi:exopolysaccharide production protein ExoY
MDSSKNGGARQRSERRLPLWKRGLDLVVLLALSPAVLLLGGLAVLVIKCGSRGPVIFRQSRVGQGGREFLLYKFRTMHTGADSGCHEKHTRDLIRSSAPMTKLDARDPRVIPLGAVLRSTGLDELPQLFNVWRGDMSLVGPRPCLRYEYDLYTAAEKQRMTAVPGLTGLWQVSGKNRTTFDEMVQLDVAYAQRQSLWLDLTILLRTLPAILGQCRDIRAARKKDAVAESAGLGKTPESFRL